MVSKSGCGLYVGRPGGDAAADHEHTGDILMSQDQDEIKAAIVIVGGALLLSIISNIVQPPSAQGMTAKAECLPCQQKKIELDNASL